MLGLPYGDLAVDAAHQEAPGLVARALELSAQAFESFEITAQPVVAPPYGILTPATLRGLDPALPVLVSDASLGEAWPDAAQEPTDLKVGRHPVLLYDAGASAGGPGPDNPLAPTALRQRIIAEAGLRSLQGQDRLVVSLPVNWDPGANSQRFGDEIGVPWLRFDSLTSVTTDARPTRLDELAMSRRRRSLATNVAAVARLVGAGRTLQNLLTNNTSVEEEVIAAALPMASYFSAGSRGAHIRAAEAAIDWIDAQLAKVTISAQSYVTLSSASGRIRVDLRNGLEQPVTVKIGAFRTSPIEISAPGQVTLEAGGTTSVLINAEATQLGMHRVRLYVTDSEDTALGAYDDLPIRATEVGQTIWVIMAVGASMFAVAILARISRQVASRKRAAAGGAEEEA